MIRSLVQVAVEVARLAESDWNFNHWLCLLQQYTVVFSDGFDQKVLNTLKQQLNVENAFGMYKSAADDDSSEVSPLTSRTSPRR